MNENTRFEEYERKTRKIILTIGIIAGIFFLFGLLVISSDEENYNPEETSPDFVYRYGGYACFRTKKAD